MKINYVFIDNYRGIKSGSFKLTQMGCIIGENNAGKSSVLLAVKLFFSSQKLSSGEFYDPNQNINIELHFDSITDGDINRLDVEHRERIREIIRSGHVKLVRTYFPD
jgi:predicted ATP-dependent endonuclease of OLD family